MNRKEIYMVRLRKFKKSRAFLRHCAFLMLAAPFFTSCIMEEDYVGLCPEENQEGVYKLDLRVVTQGMSTRNGLANKYRTRGNEAEDMIDISGGDYAIFIVDKDGKILQRVEPGAVMMERDPQDRYVYHLTGAFKPDAPIEEARVMMLANWKNFGGDYLAFEDLITSSSMTVGDLYENISDFNFTLRTEEEGSNRKSWTPGEPGGIPMFGLSDIKSLQRPLMELGCDLKMSRSLSKIEIADMVPGGFDANIEKCVLTTYNTKGRFIPDGIENPKWNIEDTQVLTPSIPADPSPATNLYFEKSKRTVNLEGVETEKDVFTVYVPEMKDLTDATRPVIQVYIEDFKQPLNITFGDYDPEEGIPLEGHEYTSVLRNHYYRFNVISSGSALIDFEIQTPWDTSSPDVLWDYEDFLIKFDGQDTSEYQENKSFRWIDVDEKFEDAPLNQTPERTIVISQDDWIEGTFKLTDPKLGKWMISLYGVGNTLNDHFRIDIKDPETGEWIIKNEGWDVASGRIGEEITFRIIPTDANTTPDDNIARVVMTCTTFDGQMGEVNLPFVHKNKTAQGMTSPSVNNDYYYVKQPITGFGSN